MGCCRCSISQLQYGLTGTGGVTGRIYTEAMPRRCPWYGVLSEMILPAREQSQAVYIIIERGNHTRALSVVWGIVRYMILPTREVS